jgi:hypothetical protein
VSYVKRFRAPFNRRLKYLPLKGQLITVLENDKEALLEALILLMEQNAITINFQISKTYFKW